MLSGIIGFALGVLVATGWWMFVGLLLKAKEELKAAEATKKKYEDELIVQQKQAEQVAQMLTEAIKRRQLALQQTSNAAAPTTTDPNVNPSVKDRLKRAVEFSTQQNKIDVRKGTEFQMRYNELELAKLAVLKTILADGFNPSITIKYTTGNQDMLLSEYVASLQKALD